MYILALAWWRYHVGQTSSWLLAISVGVALIGLGGVNFVHLTVSLKFNPNFLVLPDPISYLLSESLSSLWRFLELREAFLRDFSSLSNFLLSWANNCLAGLDFLLPSWWHGNWLSPFCLSRTFDSTWWHVWYVRPHTSCIVCKTSQNGLTWEPAS